jgi:hypothetical protein
MWNEFMRKKRLERRTLGNTGSGEKERSHAFQTMFQFIDADEGRLVNGSHLNGKNASTRQNLMVQPYPFSIRTTRQLSERAVVGAARLMLTLVATRGRP